MSKRRTSPSTKRDRALEEIYAEIPRMKSCSGQCATACGPIAMFQGEWERVKRAKGYTPRMPRGSLVCPMLSPTGKCTVYTVRPYICRLWGATHELQCPEGCEPERWLTIEEAHDIHRRIGEIAGPEIAGPMGPGIAPVKAITDGVHALWEGFALQQRHDRAQLIEAVKKAHGLIEEIDNDDGRKDG